ncbi:MAG: AAA family ATPase [Tepidisphaera sp.]|nr:AAA family ATPase [Tepidisphaera sp.]
MEATPENLENPQGSRSWIAARAGADDALVRDLTGPQREAVLCTQGPLLVLAAAGSGKTRVITRRIAHLLATGVKPWQILALTFTNKAAGEMRERIGKLLEETAGGGGAVRGLTVTTFHSLCARLLRKYAEAAGLKPDFTIYDSDDQSKLCKKVIEQLQLSTANFPPRSVLSAVSRAKNELMDAESFAARATDFSSKNIARVYKAYSAALRAANAVDFDDLLLLTARTLERNAQVRGECQARWRYLLVDEYQDTNRAQFLIAAMIAGDGERASGGELPASSLPGVEDEEEGEGTGGTPVPRDGIGKKVGPNICVVGDPDQAIYGWRGADISNILDFERSYPGCRVITLGENFRSTAPILEAADTLIRHNKRRKHKDLFTSRKGGEKPEAILTSNEKAEARVVADWLKARHEAGAAWRDMAIFYRTNSLSRVMEESLRAFNVPYSIARGTAFYDREEVRSALAYLRIVANPADGVSLSRIINVPARGISKATQDVLEAFAERDEMPLMEACRGAGGVAELNARAQAAVAKFVAMVDAWTGGGTFMGSDISGSLADLVDRIIRESGLRAMYVAQANTSKSETDAERVDNLDELVSSARQFEQEYDAAADAANDPLAADGLVETPPLLAMLRAYLESIALVADADSVDPTQGSVTLMTLHAAKGLEFDSVAMIGMEEGLLPHSRAISMPVAGDAELEEERRLCFVGITRAMRRLLMTSAKYRTIRGVPERTIPSRFLGEIPERGLIVSDQSETFAEDYDAPAGGWGVDTGRYSPPRGGGFSAVSPSSGASSGSGSSSGASRGPAGEFPVGSKVRHPQFGLGIVESISGGPSPRAVIKFKDVGSKTMVLEYARLVRVQG